MEFGGVGDIFRDTFLELGESKAALLEASAKTFRASCQSRFQSSLAGSNCPTRSLMACIASTIGSGATRISRCVATITSSTTRIVDLTTVVTDSLPMTQSRVRQRATSLFERPSTIPCACGSC